MKPHPRIRKTIKWGGAAVTVLLALTLTASAIAPQHWQQGTHGLRGLEPGYFAFEWMQPTYGIHRAWSSGFFRMMWPTFYDGPRGSWITIPIGGPTLLALCITIAAWRLDVHSRRAKPLHPCPKCGYDRTGILQDAKCPECGTSPS